MALFLKSRLLKRLALGVGLGLFYCALLYLALLAYVTWSKYSEHDVLPSLVKMPIMRFLFLDQEAVDFVGLTQLNAETFETEWDFSRRIFLSKALFDEVDMYGHKKYAYRANQGIYDLVVWTGLETYKLTLPETDAINAHLQDRFLKRKVFFQTDAHGFKPVYPAVNPGDETVFVLGDSFTEGLWVSPENTFSSVASSIMSREADAKVVNLGVSGYSVMESHWMLEHHYEEYHPKWVVLNLFLNDVEPYYFSVIGNGEIAEENWQAMFSEMDAIEDFCQQHGCQLLVSVIPAREQHRSSSPSQFHDRVSRWCHDHSVAYLDVLPEFAKYDADSLYFTWDPHFSENGHRVYGEFIAAQLLDIMSVHAH